MSALTDYFTSLANAIRSKTGKSDALTPSQMISEIENIPSGSSVKLQSIKACTVKSLTGNIEPISWSKLSSINSTNVWTDGDNIYYSNGSSSHYVLDKATSTWKIKKWKGMTSFNGSYIWTDGDNIYYSNSSSQYILNKSTSTWSTKTWTGLTNFDGLNVWTDGDDIYYSNSSTQYVLDKSKINL